MILVISSIKSRDNLQTVHNTSGPKMSLSTFQCSHCENVFAKDGHLQKHLRKSHFRVAGNKDYREVSSDKKTKSLQCSHCDETFRKQRHLDAHVSDAHGWLDQDPEDDPEEVSEFAEDHNTLVVKETKEEMTIATVEETAEGEDDTEEVAEEVPFKEDSEDHNTLAAEESKEETTMDTVEVPENTEVPLENIHDNAAEKDELEDETVVVKETGEEKDSVDEATEPIVIEGEPETKNVNGEEEMDYTEETPLEESISYEDVTGSSEQSSLESEENLSSNANETDTSISEGLNSLEIKKEQPLVLDDAAFDRLEEEVRKEQAKNTEVERENKPSKTEKRKSETPSTSGRTSRRSTRTPVTYSEDLSDEEFEKKYLRKSTRETKSATKTERVQTKTGSSKKENRGRPRQDRLTSTPPSGRTSRRSTRTQITYNEDSEDEEENEVRSRRSKKRRESSSDFVIDGEAIISEVEEDVVNIVDEDEILEVVEITPMTDEEEEFLIPRTRTKISRVNVREARRDSRKQGKRYECRLCYQVLYGELKMNLHMKLNHTKPKKRNQVVQEKQISTKSKVKEVRVMLKKVKPVKSKSPEPSFKCDFGKCRRSFKTQKERDLHKEDVHLYKCTKCIGTIIFETKSVFQAHMKKYHDLPCKECSLIFDNEETLRRHQGSVHPHCEVCEDDFSWPSPGHSCHFTRRRQGGKY